MNGNKTCDSACPCIYRFMNSGTIGYGCNYTGYCDFQRPRDSRSFQMPKEKEEYKVPETTDGVR